MHPRNWTGRWIWTADRTPYSQRTVLFKKEFHVEDPRAPVRIVLSAASLYQLYVNGTKVGRGPHRSDPRFRYYDEHRVERHLAKGTNQIVCLVHHYHRGEDGFRTRNLYDGPPGLLVDVERELPFGSDESWLTAPAPGWRDTAITGHRFHPPIHHVDADLFERGMEQLFSNRSTLDWTPAVIAGEVGDPLYAWPSAPEIPPLETFLHAPAEIESILNQAAQIDPPVKWLAMGAHEEKSVIGPGPEGAWLIFRLPCPMAGTYRLGLSCAEAAEIDLYCGEGAECYLSDRLHVRGECVFEPVDWRGGDRVAVHIRRSSQPVTLTHFHFEEWRYPYRDLGRFACNDRALNQVWEICRRTARQGTLDHLVDCVCREQALWVEDILVHGQAIGALFGDMRPVRKSVLQALRAMNREGVAPVPGPVGLSYAFGGPVLPWSGQPLALPLIVDQCELHEPDEPFARYCVQRFGTMFGFFSRYLDTRGLLNTHPEGLRELVPFCGWDAQLKRGVPTGFNSLYVLALKAASRLAVSIGDTEQGERWSRQAERTRRALHAQFWDDTRCVFVDGESPEGRRVESVSLTANAWAALAEAVPPNRAGSWAEALTKSPGIPAPCSPYDASLWLMALAGLDLELHFAHSIRSYFGSIAEAGHPTLPEFWSEGERAMGGRRGDSSRCHAYGSAPAFLLAQYVAGIRPLQRGWSRVRVRPRRIGLDEARTVVPTPLGAVRVEWRYSTGCWDLWLDIPEQITVEVELPRLGWNGERLVIDGAVVWTAPRWDHFVALSKREFDPLESRTVRWTLAGAGETHLRLETF